MFESGSYKSLPEHVALYEAFKRRRDDQDPPPQSPDSDLSKKKRHDSDASGSKQPPAPQSSAWKTFDTREAPSISPKQKSVPHSEQPVEDVPIPDDFQMEECHLLLTDQVDLVNPEGHRVVPDMSKPLPLRGPPVQAANYPDFGLEELVLSPWIESEREYDISAAYGISHWWFKCKEFYLNRHSAPSDRHVVRSHMRILSVVSLKTISRYNYTYLKEIVLRRADFKEYKILESDFKNLHPNDFEDLDRNDQKKMMRETEVHKFSNGTLNKILDKLDDMVKDFKLLKYNPSMESRIWFEDDRRSKDFMEVIERRLKIRRIFRSLESFVSGRLKDVNYRLIQRTE
ncbi:hypothetical protein Tco_0596236 [Tanacetum coccineum]